ncbi:hypothetical protein [uncultured Corynebacterium sp.]|uniref:hypothetical protein n=1 Tax=uncultured Corynebacterium sp. TaxID=159447 RepID=UPI0026277AC6|nr:hypothetical protein [uncultured Corynebacterium sp.]
MRLRRSILAAVLAPTVALASVTPAVAETENPSSSTGSSSSAEGSSDSDEWWDGLHPVAKVAIGIAAATGISVAFGILRTIFYNIFHV